MRIIPNRWESRSGLKGSLLSEFDMQVRVFMNYPCRASWPASGILVPSKDKMPRHAALSRTCKKGETLWQKSMAIL